MEQVRAFLSPLTDWMPPEVRGLLDVEVWWLIFLTAGLLLLLLLGLTLRAVWRVAFRNITSAAGLSQNGSM